MKKKEVIDVRLTWGQIQDIWSILLERGRKDLIRPFDTSVKEHIKRSEEEPDAYTRR